MFKHLVITKEEAGSRSHTTIVSYKVMEHRLFLKLQKGKLTTLELCYLVGEILRREPEVKERALSWQPLNSKRGTAVRSGFSGCCDYYVTFEDNQTGFISRHKIFHDTMSGYVETKTDGTFDIFLPDFLLLGINNELPSSSKFFIDALTNKLDDSGIYNLINDSGDIDISVKINEADNSKYSTSYVGSLAAYIESIEKLTEPAEEEVAGEVVGE